MRLREFMTEAKTLGDESRVWMLLALRGGEMCVCQMTELLGLAWSTTSKHLSILYQAGLVDAREKGRWIDYSLPERQASAAARTAIRWANRALATDQQIAEDSRRRKRVLALDPAALCRRLCRA
jgi:DNA-binding transcriptional ArsR family regulator